MDSSPSSVRALLSASRLISYKTHFKKHCEAFEARFQVQICVKTTYFGNVINNVSFFKFGRCFPHNIPMFLEVSVMKEIVGAALCLVHISPSSLDFSLCPKDLISNAFQSRNVISIE